MKPECDAVLATLIICTYNQERYIKESIAGALAQTYQPLEILISDDCSSDATFEIVEELVRDYPGPHHIRLNRNSKNLGLIEHVNKVFELANGELIIGSAGDDISLPERCQKIVDTYCRHGRKPSLLHSNVIEISPSSKEIGVRKPDWGTGYIQLKETALKTALYIGASSAFSRSLLDSFPPMQEASAYEDLVWGFRAALVNAVIFIDEPLVKYRISVGISWQNLIEKPDTTEKAVAQKLYNLRLELAVFSQRLIDLDTQPLTKEHTKTKKALLRRHAKTRILESMYSKNKNALLLLLRHPVLYLQCQRSYLKFFRRLTNGRISETEPK